MPLHIVELKSGGQQLPGIKKNHSGNRSNLEKSSFFIKSTKNIRFLPKSQTAQWLRICIIPNLNQEVIFNHKQKKKSLHTLYSQKKNIFLSKNHKNTAF